MQKRFFGSKVFFAKGQVALGTSNNLWKLIWVDLELNFKAQYIFSLVTLFGDLKGPKTCDLLQTLQHLPFVGYD